MLNWVEFRHQLQGACMLIAAETGVSCYISHYPENPLPGDKAAITIGSDMDIYEGNLRIPIHTSVFDFDLYALRDTSRRIDVFAIMHEELITGFYRNNPQYAAWKLKQE